jgi:hypothetical protein
MGKKNLGLKLETSYQLFVWLPDETMVVNEETKDFINIGNYDKEIAEKIVKTIKESIVCLIGCPKEVENSISISYDGNQEYSILFYKSVEIKSIIMFSSLSYVFNGEMIVCNVFKARNTYYVDLI